MKQTAFGLQAIGKDAQYMNILVVGCGKVGLRLAESLCRDGHDVSLLDGDASSFDSLTEDCLTTVGVPIDQDVLRKAGIETCDALAAVSHDDTTNIMAAQVARQIFHVPIIVCRIYDPRLEDVFTHFGIHTICPTKLTVASIKSVLFDDNNDQQLHFGAHTVNFSRLPVPKALYDQPLEEAECEPEQSVFGVEHADHSFTLAGSAPIRLRAGDTLILSKIVD